MVVRRLRKTLKRSLSIAMAAALMVTSVPELSVTAAEQEAVSKQDIPEETAPAETEEGAPQDGSTAEGISTEITSAEQKEDTAETQESSTEQHETKSISETESASDTQSMTEREDSIESETETAQQTETEAEEETTESEAEAETEERIDKKEEAVQGTIIFENDFNEIEADTELAKGKVKQLAEGNMAVEYNADFTKGWEQPLNADSFQLDAEYTAGIKEKAAMIFDVYFPDNVGDIGTIKAQAVLRNGEQWDWKAASNTPAYTASDLVTDSVTGYKKLHVSIEITGGSDWEFGDITSLRAITPCLAGDTSTYNGKLYIDNVKLIDTSSASGDNESNQPGEDEQIIYENNFDEVTDLTAILEDATESGASLEEIAQGNKAIKYTTGLAGEGWENIFQAQFNLSAPYDGPIGEKLVMSYDVYFPVDKIGDSFVSMKAQAVLKSGSDWKWISQKSWPEFQAADLIDDANVPGYKKAHVQIDMDNFEANGEAYPFEQITPIQAVIPCLAGSGSKYSGELYLDNLTVWAVNETTETPDPTEDVVLTLDASAWTVGDKYQYNGESKIENKTIGDKKFLAFTVDYAKVASTVWI